MSSKPITLYGSKQSGHSYKARLFLLLADVEHDYCHVDIFVPRDEREKSFKDISPFGEVPVLVHGEQVLSQSNAILLHLARHFNFLGAKDEAGWSAISSWLFWEANRIGRSYPNHRFNMLFDKSADATLTNWFEMTARTDLDRLNLELDGKEFLLGDITVADISCAAYLLYHDNPTVDISNWPNVNNWLERIKARPNWINPIEALSDQESSNV